MNIHVAKRGCVVDDLPDVTRLEAVERCPVLFFNQQPAQEIEEFAFRVMPFDRLGQSRHLTAGHVIEEFPEGMEDATQLRVTLEGRIGQEDAGQRTVALLRFRSEALQLDPVEAQSQAVTVDEAVELEFISDESKHLDRVPFLFDHRPRLKKSGQRFLEMLQICFHKAGIGEERATGKERRRSQGGG